MQHDDTRAGPFPVLEVAWQQVALETMVTILAWRRHQFDQDRAWTSQQALACHDVNVQRVLENVAYRMMRSTADAHAAGQIVQELRQVFAGTIVPSACPADNLNTEHVLFFGGGSRGNPAGGAGAVIVRVDPRTTAATVVWSAAMSYADLATTNNQAEYNGLLTGLKAARQYGWHCIEVIGDSALIIRQMRTYRPPKNVRLRDLYVQSRQVADCLNVRSWNHHRRANNKMADSLANLAMDSCTSSQTMHPTSRAGHVDLANYLYEDLRPWLASRPPC